MYYLAEDSSYVLAALGLVAVGLLVALKVTQQGKFLLWAGIVAAVAVGIFGFERYWVTDAERIEAVVYDLGKAVEASDVDRIKSHLDDRVTFGMRGQTIDGSLPLRLVFPYLRRTRFDFVRVSRLTTSAGGQSRRGSAEFAVTATGIFDEGGAQTPLGSVGTEWSMGFREVSPGVWKINRITALKLPREVARVLFGGR
jgi:ketosteroid isomerase-like protein